MPGLLLHAGPSSDLPDVLHSAANAVKALGAGVRLEVIVQGAGVAGLAHGTDLAGSLPDLLKKGVRILACEYSMRSTGLEAAALPAGVGTVPAAVGHLAQRQWDGWAYIRLWALSP